MWRWLSHEPRRLGLLHRRLPPPRAGSHAVQVLRTYPARRRVIPFAPDGERSIARAYLKALGRARSLVYIEDQYLWGTLVADALAAALRRAPELRMIIVLPRHPDRDGRISGRAARAAQWRAINNLVGAGGPRVAVYDLENEQGTPIYVHAKAVVIDDVWAMVGSANLNRRSWTHDSEVACAVVDQERDPRRPTDPGGLGDGARVFARQLRCGCGASTSGSPATPMTPGCSTRSPGSRPGGRPRPGSRPGTTAPARGPGHPAGSGPTRSSWRRPSRPAGRPRCTGSPSTPTAAPSPYDATPPSSTGRL
jgi:hypothetical protein